MKQRKVNLFPWKWEGVVVAGGTPQSFAAWAKRTYGIEVNVKSKSAGYAVVDYGYPWLLWVETLKNIPILAHEALHISAGVIEGRGIKLKSYSEEAITYTLEYLLDQILKKGTWRNAR